MNLWKTKTIDQRKQDAAASMVRIINNELSDLSPEKRAETLIEAIEIFHRQMSKQRVEADEAITRIEWFMSLKTQQ